MQLPRDPSWPTHWQQFQRVEQCELCGAITGFFEIRRPGRDVDGADCADCKATILPASGSKDYKGYLLRDRNGVVQPDNVPKPPKPVPPGSGPKARTKKAPE